MSWPVIMTFIGALLSAVGAVLASLDQAKEAKENSTLYKKLAGKSDEIAAIQKELKDKSDSMVVKQGELIIDQKKQLDKTEEIARLNKELSEKSDEIAKLNKETTNNVTGGDSFCYVWILPVDDKTAKISLIHQGKYPLSELTFKVRRELDLETLNEQQKSGKITTDEWISGEEKLWHHFNIGSLPVDEDPSNTTVRLFGAIPCIFPYNETYKIEFEARNGKWEETYSFYLDTIGIVQKFKVGRFIKDNNTARYVILKEHNPRK